MTTTAMSRRPLYRQLWVHVLIAMALGVVLGYVNPDLAKSMKPLGDGFIKLIRMVIAPIIFVTVVSGIYKMQSMKEVGRIGVRALIYFEVVSTLALIMGLVVALVFKPGAGVNADPAQLDASAMAPYVSGAAKQTATEFLLNIIPSTLVGAFADGQILQVMLISILVGLALLKAGDRVGAAMQLLDQVSAALFALLGLIMTFAAVGTFGAMAFTVGAYGLTALLPLAKFVIAIYATCILFTLVVLACGADRRLPHPEVHRLQRRRFFSSGDVTSEVALPRLMTSSTAPDAGRRRRARRADGMLVQHRWVGHLSIDGSMLFTGHEPPPHMAADDHDLRGDVGDVKRRRRRLGMTFVTLAATLATVQTMPVAAWRSCSSAVHVDSEGDDQHDRQRVPASRSRDGTTRGWCARTRVNAPSALRAATRV
jgi:aerobic C4-dicarboxylate transport protein